MFYVYHYTKFFSSIHKAVEPPVVSVSETGSKVAGTPYTLTCRVTLPSGVHVESESINIQWLKLKSYNKSFTPPIVHSSDGSYTVNLTINPLLEANGGNYTCIANYSLSIFPSPVVLSNVLTFNVIPRGKYNSSFSFDVHDLLCLIISNVSCYFQLISHYVLSL